MSLKPVILVFASVIIMIAGVMLLAEISLTRIIGVSFLLAAFFAFQLSVFRRRMPVFKQDGDEDERDENG